MTRRAVGPQTAGPRPAGLVVIQLDGVGVDVLERAIEAGLVPTIEGWIRSGSHRLLGWRCRLPSQTSASQAGIMYGPTEEIPGFRWYEKDRGQLVVSNHPGDAALIEARLAAATDPGLLFGGASIANLLSGDAARAAFTLSSLGRGLETADELYLHVARPSTFWRLVVAATAEILREIAEGWRQRLRRVRPRVSRGGSFPFLRAASNVLLRDLGAHQLRVEMRAGVPVAYATFVGYDVVAHHAGPLRKDALRVLRELDGLVGSLATFARRAPREYRFVLLSDHGQSQGRTFRQLTGRTLEELVGELAHTESVEAPKGRGEAWGHLNALLSEAIQGEERRARTARRLLTPRRRGPYVEVGPDRLRKRRVDTRVVVCASGSLGHIYLPDWPDRLDVGTIEAAFPGLVSGLAASDGVGFALVRTTANEPLVVGAGGIHRLEDGQVEGDDPLAPYGQDAAAQLRRLDASRHVGDIVVNGAYDPGTGEVTGFEELVGTHGGLGGEQTRAFLLWPTDGSAPAPEDGVDLDGLHDALRALRTGLLGDGDASAGPSLMRES